LQTLVDASSALLIPFVLLVLACYRVARFIVTDDGPWRFMLRIRTRLGVYDLGENGRPRSMLGEMFSCPYCIGLWVALFMAVGLGWFLPWPVTAVCWWAIAGGQSFLEARS
jgi:hypothetical protein